MCTPVYSLDNNYYQSFQIRVLFCFFPSSGKVVWPVQGEKHTRWLCVTMALPSPHQGQPLIPACTDEVREHRLAKSQSHFHLLWETTPSCCETADPQLTHCHGPDNTASLTPVLCAPCCFGNRCFSSLKVSPFCAHSACFSPEERESAVGYRRPCGELVCGV